MPCLKEITTPTGTFIAYNNAVGREEARKICNDNNSILAPIMTQQDKDAVLKLTSRVGCPQNDYWPEYHVGLEVVPSCTNQKKYFSNGRAWDETLHSHLYIDETTSDYALAVSVFTPMDGQDSLKIVDCTNDNYCNPFHSRFICFREAQSCASRLVQESKEINFRSLLSFSHLLNFVFAAFFIATVTRKYYRKNSTEV